MKIDIGLSPLEALCALGGIIGFFAALVQIWEFIEKRPPLRKLLLGMARGIVVVASLSIFAVTLIFLAPALKGDPKRVDAQALAAAPRNPAAPVVSVQYPNAVPPRKITRWVVVVPNNVPVKQYERIRVAATNWTRSVADDDLVTMVSFSDKGVVVPMKDIPGSKARADLPERVAELWMIPRGSIEEAIRKAEECLFDRTSVAVILTDADPKGYVEAGRASTSRATFAGDDASR